MIFQYDLKESEPCLFKNIDFFDVSGLKTFKLDPINFADYSTELWMEYSAAKS